MAASRETYTYGASPVSSRIHGINDSLAKHQNGTSNGSGSDKHPVSSSTTNSNSFLEKEKRQQHVTFKGDTYTGSARRPFPR